MDGIHISFDDLDELINGNVLRYQICNKESIHEINNLVARKVKEYINSGKIKIFHSMRLIDFADDLPIGLIPFIPLADSGVAYRSIWKLKYCYGNANLMYNGIPDQDEIEKGIITLGIITKIT